MLSERSTTQRGGEAGGCSHRQTALSHLRVHQIHAPRLHTRIHSNKDGSKGQPDVRKADFSAFWSLKIREFFDNRKKNLEESERKGMPEPEIVKKLQKQAGEQMEAMQLLGAEEAQLRAMKLQARQELAQEALRDAPRRLSLDPKARVPMQPEGVDALTEQDIELARANL